MKKSLYSVIFMAVVFSFLFSITLRASEEGIEIGVLQKSRSDQFNIILNDAQSVTLDALKESGKISDYYQFDAEEDIQKQLNQADDLIAMKVDVIVLSSTDANGCAPIVTKCKEAKIPLVIVNALTSNADEATATVFSNDVNAGEIMGNYIIERLGGKGKAKGKVLQLEGYIGNTAQMGRDEGFKNAVSKESGITVLESLSARWQRDEAMRITEDWLQKYPEISAIAAENDNMAMGALNAVINAGRKDDIIIIGVDAIEDALLSVEDSELDATIFQNGKAQGKNSILVALAIASGETYAKKTEIPFELVTKKNVSDFLNK